MKIMKWAPLLAMLAAMPAAAQQTVLTPDGVNKAPVIAMICLNLSMQQVNCGGGSTGTGGPVTGVAGAFVDGAIVSLGSLGDTAWSGSGSGSLIALNKAADGFLSTLAGAVRTNDAGISRAQTHDDTVAAAQAGAGLKVSDTATSTIAGAVRANDAGTSRAQTHDDTVAAAQAGAGLKVADTATATIAGAVRANDAGTSRAQTHDDTLAATQSGSGLLVRGTSGAWTDASYTATGTATVPTALALVASRIGLHIWNGGSSTACMNYTTAAAASGAGCAVGSVPIGGGTAYLEDQPGNVSPEAISLVCAGTSCPLTIKVR